MEQKFKGLSIRKLQAIASLCLVQFCRAQDFRHPAIEELVEHQLRLLITDHLPNWESEGADLDLPGRGDDLPPEVMVIVPLPVAFKLLVEYSSEVGLICMYGKTTDDPLRYLSECFKILAQAGVEPPDVDDLFELEGSDSKMMGWGEPFSGDEYERVRARYLSIWQGR